jgi:hypothetical protein
MSSLNAIRAEPSMTSFDFITDPQFRRSLESDFAELELCYAAHAWKAVHVLAGSIIEALLIDSLASLHVSQESPESLRKKDLQTLISECEAKQILSQRTGQLSTVVRSYRNLIHPGRVIRLKEKTDEQSATIARSLVQIIVNEVETQKRQRYSLLMQPPRRTCTSGAAYARERFSSGHHDLTRCFIRFNLLPQISHHSVLPVAQAHSCESRSTCDPIDARSRALPALR